MHSKGVIHRDIKPSNIIYQVTGKVETIKLVDFSDAVFESDNEFPMLGHPNRNYHAPESMFSLNKYGKECDLYSVGAVMFKL